MAKRKESGFQLIASMHWPAGLVLGLVGFVGLRYGVGWMLKSSANPLLSAMGKQASTDAYLPFAWIAMLACLLAATVSFIARRNRRQLLASQSGFDSLHKMSWREFEVLVGEAFRRQGYAVTETGQGGADGGIDLKLRKDGKTTLVQCKQWRSRQVGVNVVREMYGVLVDAHASSVKIVALGNFTPDAAAFARGKPIELVNGHALLSTVQNIQARKEPASALDNPLLFAGGAGACLLIALLLPSQRAAVPRTSSAGEAHTSVVALPVAPAIAPAPAAPVAHVPVQPVYKAEPPMSNEAMRDWERRNREAMKIMEKSTPELPTAPAR